MASSSSNNSSLALVKPPRRNYYDVFVTFRGEDTRYNFTDHLFDALKRKGISVFRDDTNLQKGECIGPELLRAIEVSQIFVVVFSMNYASSTWCLQELEKICQCIQVSEKHVLPIFYDVDPSEVRHQKEVYGDAFVKHNERYHQDSEKVQKWREALKQVANLSGWDVRDKPQSVEIKKIVERIINILDYKSSCVPKDLVGMDSPIEELEKLLLLNSSDDVRAIGICGMGGIGKTSLATVLYDKISHQFGACCFIDDVSKIYRSHNGPLDLQKQILHQTLGEEYHQICNHYNATNLIRRRLYRVRAFLILDNVDQVEQLEKIVISREWLGVGSRIIIISRDEHILKVYGVDAIYQVSLLNKTNSLQLLCRKAFKLDRIIMSNYEKLAYDVLEYANGLPLAIKVLGSFLCGRDILEWRSALARLRESPEKDVMDVLRLSFDGLKESEKEIFLHIACFFDHKEEEYVKNVLNCCGFHADIGFRVLIDKSLIVIKYKEIEMHNLLKELGKKIAQENSSKDQRKWGRIWLQEQLWDIKEHNMEKHVEAIVFNEYGDMNMDHDMSKMTHLKLLISIKHMTVSESLNCQLPNELRYVEWDKYPFINLPSRFQPNQLVELILRYSKIKQLWKGKKYLPKLKTLDLSYSKNLIKLPHFEEFSNLERLNLEDCIQLVRLDPSIGILSKLVFLNLKDCKNLASIPNNIFGLSSLKYLYMSGCSKVFNDKREISMSLFPTLITKKVMLPSFTSLYSLREVDISFCGLSQLPSSIGCLHEIEKLNLNGNNFVSLPSLRELSKLIHLQLKHCKLLESLPDLPSPIAIEYNEYWDAKMHIYNCPKLGEREHFSNMTFSWMIQLIMVHSRSSHVLYDAIDIVIPGSKVPSWLNNPSLDYISYISIDRSPFLNDNDNNIIGLACCIVFSMTPDPAEIKRASLTNPDCAHMKLGFTNNRGRINFHHIVLDEDFITLKSNHIWLIYFPRDSYYGISQDTIRIKLVDDDGLGLRIKDFGFRWVYKHDLEELNSIMIHAA